MTTTLNRRTGTDAGRPPPHPGRPASGRAFTGLAVASFGGPLALAALVAPGLVAGAVVGVGAAVSVAGVMLAEYLALSRLIGAVTSWRQRPVITGLGIALVAAAPLTHGPAFLNLINSRVGSRRGDDV